MRCCATALRLLEVVLALLLVPGLELGGTLAAASTQSSCRVVSQLQLLRWCLHHARRRLRCAAAAARVILAW